MPLESSDFALILDEDSINSIRRLFMTATPRFFSQNARTQAVDSDWALASMDDDEKFGPVFHKLSFGEAIERGLLTDYQVAVVVVDDDTYRDYAERGQFVTMDGKTSSDARLLASQIGLAKAMREYDLRRVISFHSRVDRAYRFVDQLPAVIRQIPPDERPLGELWCSHVSGRMPSGERDAKLGRSRKSWKGSGR